MTALKFILMLCISAMIGDFVLMIFESMPINIWIARFIGGVGASLSALLFAYLFIFKNEKQRQ
ncbi:hypothetical protein [Staphylococcus warneri]|uniref:hypothetical protein n=1 Tax=Staphylococcus warneri TaxID=1292 RepID=UPI001F571AED|nr:hypothetical protein [Staphylococcus warneri]MCI2748851.1 hypothetical protein [Staphylococcus warneri]MCI2777669.1 hypothetical protein [Staphylococcus warneri]